MLLSHVFFLVFGQSTALLFKKWWLSLAYVLLYTSMVQWAFHPYLPAPLELGMQVWVYRFLPSIMTCLVCGVCVEWFYVHRSDYPPVIGGKTSPGIAFWGVLESVVMHATLLPTMLSSSPSSISLSFFFMSISWIIYFLSHMTVGWRFKCAQHASHFYRFYYCPTISITMLCMLVGVLMTDSDEFSPTRFAVTFASAIISSLYLILVTIIDRRNAPVTKNE